MLETAANDLNCDYQAIIEEKRFSKVYLGYTYLSLYTSTIKNNGTCLNLIKLNSNWVSIYLIIQVFNGITIDN